MTSDPYYDNFDSEVDGGAIVVGVDTDLHNAGLWRLHSDVSAALEAINEGYLAAEAIDYVEMLYPNNNNVQYLVTQLRDLISYVADLQMG